MNKLLDDYSELEERALEFANLLAQKYFVERNMESLARYMDENVSWIGTGQDECSHNLLEAGGALEKEMAEYSGAFSLKECKLRAVAVFKDACIVYGNIYAVPEDPEISEERPRISLFLKDGEQGLRLIHLHFSNADMDQGRGTYYVPSAKRGDANALRREVDQLGWQIEALTKNVPGGMHQCANDPNLTLISMSDGFLSILGYTRNEVQSLFNNRFMEMVYPVDRAGMLRSIREQLRGGTEIELEYRVLCKNGMPVWILDKGRLLDDGEGGKYFVCMLMEIDDRKRDQEELRLTLERHQVILDQTTDIIFEWDIRQDTLSFSSNWRKRFGYDPIDDKISSRIPLSQNIYPEDMPAFIRIMQDTAAGLPYSETEFRIRNGSGQYFWCRIRATAQFDSDGRPIKAVGVIVDIDSEKKEKQLLIDMAQHDPLTGLYNKAAINALVERRMAGQSPPGFQAMYILDVDYFKLVNDNYGHLAGDSILSDVAATLKNHVRSSDLVGRIGGDEFLVYLPAVTDKNAAEQKAQEILEALHIITPEKGALPITCSIGAAVFAYGEVGYQELFRYADLALYRRKDIGRNGFTLYDRDIDFEDPQLRPHTIVDSELEISAAEGNMAQYTFRTLYVAKDIDEAIRKLLEIIGRSFDVSRAYVFESSEDGKYCSNTFEWCGEGIEPQIEQLQNISYEEDLDDYLSNFNSDGLFYCADVRATAPHLRSVLEPQGIRSMLQCAMLDEGEFVGYVGFDECRNYRAWTPKQIASFKLTADVLSVFLVKLRQKQKMENK